MSASKLEQFSLHPVAKWLLDNEEALQSQQETARNRITTASQWSLSNVARGIGRTVKDAFWSSRITTPFVWSAIAVGVLLALVSNPVGWMIAAAAVAGLALKFIVTAAYDKMKTGKGPITVMAAECSTIKWRFLKSQEARASHLPIEEYLKQIQDRTITASSNTTSSENEESLSDISDTSSNDLAAKRKALIDAAVGGTIGEIFLIAAPNQRDNHLEQIIPHSRCPIGMLMTAQEPWEMEVAGMTAPSEQDLNGLGIKRIHIQAADHHYPRLQDLDAAADDMYECLIRGKSVAVHCKAGQGRSAMIVAAFLIKYCGMSAEKAKDWILERRSTSTIAKKLEDKKKASQNPKSDLGFYGLKSYAGYCCSGNTLADWLTSKDLAVSPRE